MSMYDVLPDVLVEEVVKRLDAPTSFRFLPICKASATDFTRQLAVTKAKEVSYSILSTLLKSMKAYADKFDDGEAMEKLVVTIMKALWDRQTTYMHEFSYFDRIFFEERQRATMNFFTTRTGLHQNIVNRVWLALATGTECPETEENVNICYQAFKEYCIGDARTFELVFETPGKHIRIIAYIDFTYVGNQPKTKLTLLVYTFSETKFNLASTNICFDGSTCSLIDEQISLAVEHLHNLNGHFTFLKDFVLKPTIYVWPKRDQAFPQSISNLYATRDYYTIMNTFAESNFQVRTSDFW